MILTRICRFQLTALLVLLLLAHVGSAQAEVCPSAEEQRALELINAERAAVGAPPLVFDRRLAESAARHSADMSEGQFLSHTGSDGTSPTQRAEAAGYPTGVGETAGAGQSNAAAIVLGWMNSSGHRAILLNASWRHVGIAYAPTSWFYRHVWTANFGRAPGSPEPLSASCGGATPPPQPLGRPGRPFLANP